MTPEHDPQVLVASLHLRRHLTGILDSVDMPEPVRTAVVDTLLAAGDIDSEARPEVVVLGGQPTPVLTHCAALTIRHPYPGSLGAQVAAPEPAPAGRLGGLAAASPFPDSLAALPIDDPLVKALSDRINARSWLIMPRTIGGVVAALREVRPDGNPDPNDEQLLDTVAVRIGYSGHGRARLSIVRLVIEALNAETAEATR